MVLTAQQIAHHGVIVADSLIHALKAGVPGLTAERDTFAEILAETA